MRVAFVMCSLALLVAVPASTRAQTPRGIPRLPMPEAPPQERQPPDAPTFSVTVTRVEVSALVVDDKGQPVPGLAAEDFEAWERMAGIRIGPGDAIFVRTGRWARRAAQGPWNIGEAAAGLDASVIPWLRQRDVALMGTEDAVDVIPFPTGTVITDPDDYRPVHNFTLSNEIAYIQPKERVY